MRASLALAVAALLGTTVAPVRAQPLVPLSTGRLITPQGTHADVGSMPINMVVSPDGRYAVVTNCGAREYLTVLRMSDGTVASRITVAGLVKGERDQEQGLYYGLAFGTAGVDGTPLYASRGAEERIAVYMLAPDGTLTDTGRSLRSASGIKVLPIVFAGLGLSRDGSRLYAVDNNTSAYTKFRGVMHVFDTSTGKETGRIDLPGFPYAVAGMTSGPDADRKVYVSSERDGVVSVVDPAAGKALRDIRTGTAPIALLLDRAQDRLFVANPGSDTISIVDTRSDTVLRTVLLRPNDVRGLAGCTPTGLALPPDEKRLYVTLADLNAVAVVDVPAARLLGYIPVGWYPTAVAVMTDGKRLLVTSAKGVDVRNPNDRDIPGRGRHPNQRLEGTVSLVNLPDAAELHRFTLRTIANSRPFGIKHSVKNPGIKHVIYIIKENRTYDQVLGDMKQGNGDTAVCMFPREVTPNQHALAERFVLMDNFYCCAEVSADGWNWSTSGMASEYTVRNPPYEYSGRGRVYDFEGQNNGSAVDLMGLHDVAAAPSGYIWDDCVRHGVDFRNYGFFLNQTEEGDLGPDGKPLSVYNAPNKKALVGRTDPDFLQFDTRYADSDAWVTYNSPSPKQQKSYGTNHATSRFAEWKREFDAYVRNGNLPRFMMVRFMRDHTAGTSPGQNTPSAMVADNDYAVGCLVEAVSKSPYWKSTAIFVVEDDAQNGNDHVDCHRSTAYVISPFVRKGTVDSRYYNTDSVLRTMELLLGLPPMNQYDAAAPPFAFFTSKPQNDAPYHAILPNRSVVTAVNKATAYCALDSTRLDFATADAVPDDLLNDIVWHATMGVNTPRPPVRHGLVLREPDGKRD